MRNHLYIALGWFFVALAAVGVILPLLPTTPFLILAAALFARSSPRFHQMLLKHRIFGPVLEQWEATRTITRQTKYRASAVIVIAFATSVLILNGRTGLQLMLVSIAVLLLVAIWRINEDPTSS